MQFTLVVPLVLHAGKIKVAMVVAATMKFKQKEGKICTYRFFE